VERSGTEICSNSVIFQKLAKLTTDKLVTWFEGPFAQKW
jgi:hypothetical protein